MRRVLLLVLVLLLHEKSQSLQEYLCSSLQVRNIRAQIRQSSKIQQTEKEETSKYISDDLRWMNQVAEQLDPRIEPAYFDGLRGLKWTGDGNRSPPSERRLIAQIPVLNVMSSESLENLACILWEQVEQGQGSRHAGYIKYLMRQQQQQNVECRPPLVAPDTIRHWTAPQLELFQSSPAGRRLLDLLSEQNISWQKSFNEFVDSATAAKMTREQFMWAMEVVHSRSFKGFTTQQDIAQLLLSSPKLLAPILFALTGTIYSLVVQDPSSEVLLVLVAAALATLPLGLNALKESNQYTATLLPIIDSANHACQADSTILFDPASRSFQLYIGPGSSTDPYTQQLFVSYGEKEDTELLLNYGFLPSVDYCAGDNEDRRRQLLAEAFLARNAEV